jgi:hypothetical protein
LKHRTNQGFFLATKSMWHAQNVPITSQFALAFTDGSTGARTSRDAWLGTDQPQSWILWQKPIHNDGPKDDCSPNQELSDFYDNPPEVTKTRDRPPKQMPSLSDEASTKRDCSSYTAQPDVIDRPPKQELSDFYDDLPPSKAPSDDGESSEQRSRERRPATFPLWRNLLRRRMKIQCLLIHFLFTL